MKRQRRDAGFTVVEVLVALSILGLLLVTLTSSLGYAQHIFRLANDNGRHLAEIGVIRKLLLESLSQTGGSENVQDARIVADGRSISIVGVPPRILAAAQPLVLTLRPAEGDVGLVAAWRSEQERIAISRAILSPEYVARFAFFSPDLGWIDRWNQKNRLPTLVRVRFQSLLDNSSDAVLTLPVRSVLPALCAVRPEENVCKVD